jgi:hypothetical protein
MADFRELCQELVRAMDSYPLRPKAHRDLCNKVRTALAATATADFLGSPAAQAVLDAYFTCADNLDTDVGENRMVAAVLQAAAVYCKRDRLQLLAIADELNSSLQHQ